MEQVKFGLYQNDQGDLGVGVSCVTADQRREGVNIAWDTGRSRFYSGDDLVCYNVKLVHNLAAVSELDSNVVMQKTGVPAEQQETTSVSLADETNYAAIGIQSSLGPEQQTHQPIAEDLTETELENEWIREHLRKVGLDVTNVSVIEAAESEGLKIQSKQVTAIKNSLKPGS